MKIKKFLKSLLTLDGIAQIGVAVFGISAILFVSYKNKWGFVFGLLSQPFWYITVIKHKQWGILILGVIYTVSWILGFYNWFLKG